MTMANPCTTSVRRGPTVAAMSVDVRRVLRAGAVVGERFEAAVVAGLLGVDTLDVLEVLQIASDEGVPLDDLGGGVFRLPAEVAAELRAGVLPSLAGSWHAQLAAMMAEVEGAPRSADAAIRRLPDWDASSGAVSGGAAGGFVAAARQAADLGGYQRAVELLGNALDLLGSRPESAPERRARVEALVELGRVKWLAPIADERFTLASALDTVDQAAALLDEADPAALRAEVEALRANVLYDIGDAEALHEALAAVQRASRVRLEAGEPLESARYLNDEARVWARMGDPIRASGLLARSREVFADLAEQSPTARAALATTDHLVARLALHGYETLRHDRPRLDFALACAASAEKAFRELDRPQDSARARETLGRLELLQRAPDEARGHLRSALSDQHHLGDAMGLARTTAAYADLLQAADQLDEAIELFAESLELNLLKGSLAGVGHNKRSLNRLAERAAERARGDLTPEIDRLAARIAESEARPNRRACAPRSSATPSGARASNS